VILNVSNIIYLDALSNITWEQLNLGYYTKGFSNSILSTSIIDIVGLITIYAIGNNNLRGFTDQLIKIPKAYFMSIFIMFISMGEASMIGTRLLGSTPIPQHSIEIFTSHIYIMVATFTYSVFTSNVKLYGKELIFYVIKYILIGSILLASLYYCSQYISLGLNAYIQNIASFISINSMKSILIDSKYALYAVASIFSAYIIFSKILKIR
jgi:hypothetical protein